MVINLFQFLELFFPLSLPVEEMEMWFVEKAFLFFWQLKIDAVVFIITVDWRVCGQLKARVLCKGIVQCQFP